MAASVKIILDVDAATGTETIRNFGTTLDQLGVKIKSTEPAAAGARSAVDAMGQAKQRATAAAQALGQELTRLGGPIGQTAGAVLGLAGKLAGPAGVLAAVAAVGGGLALMSNNLVNSIERLDNLSRQTGLSVATLQAFQQAASETGEGFESMVPALARVNLEIASILKGAPDAGDAFRRIGVDLKGLVVSGASTEQILEQVAVRLNAIEDPQRRAAAAAELFSMRGRALMTILKTVAEEGLGGLQEQMRKTGIVTSQETNRMARAVDVEMDKISRDFKGIVNTIAIEVLPAFAEFVGAIRQLVELSRQPIILDISLTEAAKASLAALKIALFGGMPGGPIGPPPPSEEAIRTRMPPGLGAMRPSGPTPEMILADIQEAVKLTTLQFQAGLAPMAFYVATLEQAVTRLGPLAKGSREANEALLQLQASLRGIKESDAERAIAAIQQETTRLTESTAVSLEAFERWVPDLEATFRATQRWNEETNRSVQLQQQWGVQAERGEEFTLRLGTAFGKLERPVIATGEGFRVVTEEGRKFDAGLITLIQHNAELADVTEEYGEISGMTARDVETQWAQSYRRMREEAFATSANALDAAKAQGDAWRVMRISFEQQVLLMGNAMDNFERLARATALAMADAFEELFFRVMRGEFENLEEIAEQFITAIQREFARGMSGAVVGGLQAAVSGQVDWSQVFTGLTTATTGATTAMDSYTGTVERAETEVGAMSDATQKASSGMMALGQAIGFALGQLAGQAISGRTDTSASWVVTAGTTAGVAIGGAYGGPAGAAVGGAAGGALAGATLEYGLAGVLFPPPDAQNRFFDRFAKQTEESFAAGMLAALEAGNVEAGWNVFTGMMREAITQAMVQGLVQGMIVEEIMGPLIARLNEAWRAGMGPEQFRALISPAVVEAIAKIQALRPLFGETFDVLQLIFRETGLITDATAGEAEAQGRVLGVKGETVEAQRQNLELTQQTTAETANELAMQEAWTAAVEDTAAATEGVNAELDTTVTLTQEVTEAQTATNEQLTEFTEAFPGLIENMTTVEEMAVAVGEAIADWPGEVTIPVTFDVPPPPDGRQLGGWVRGGVPGRDSVLQLLEPGEFVVRRRVADEWGPMLERLNAGARPALVSPTAPMERGDLEDRRLMREQNVLLREQNRLLRDLGRARVPRGAVTV